MDMKNARDVLNNEEEKIVSVFKTTDNNELILSCSCGCDEGLRINIDVDTDDEKGIYCYQTYLSANWYKEQGSFWKKLKKIWCIIINKDYYYSEICLTKKDWETYKKWIDEH